MKLVVVILFGLLAVSSAYQFNVQAFFDKYPAAVDSTIDQIVATINELYNIVQNVVNSILATGTVIGKRELLEKGLLSGLTNFLTDAFHVIYDPIDNIAISLSGMLVHVFAGLAVDGLPAPSGRRELSIEKGLWDSLYATIYPVINPLFQDASYSIAVTLLGIANEGLGSLFGKRELLDKGLLSGLTNFLTDAFHVIYDPIDNIAISLSGMLVHVFAGLAVDGLPAPSGRRELSIEKGLWDSIYATIYPVINPLFQDASYSIAVTLLGIANDGLGSLFGKRELLEKGLLSGLTNFLTDAFHVIYDPIDNIAISLSGMLVHVFAGLAVDGLPAPSGRRELSIEKGLWDSLYATIYPVINPLFQDASYSIAVTLLGIANDGLGSLFGKRAL